MEKNKGWREKLHTELVLCKLSTLHICKDVQFLYIGKNSFLHFVLAITIERQ